MHLATLTSIYPKFDSKPFFLSKSPNTFFINNLEDFLGYVPDRHKAQCEWPNKVKAHIPQEKALWWCTRSLVCIASHKRVRINPSR